MLISLYVAGASAEKIMMSKTPKSGRMSDDAAQTLEATLGSGDGRRIAADMQTFWHSTLLRTACYLNDLMRSMLQQKPQTATVLVTW
jgi:hypothetical protein